MPQSLALGYEDFLRETAYEIDEGRVLADLDAKQRELLHSVIQAGVRQVLSPLIPGRTETHEWSWARPVGTLILRPLLTGTLLEAPTRSGDLIVLSANEAVFDSDVVGLDLVFDATGHVYTIVEYVRPSVVRLGPSERSLAGQTAQLGDYPTGMTESLFVVTSETVVTESDADESFSSDMVGDRVVYTAEYVIRRYTSASVVVVTGDAGSESGAFTVKRLSLNDGARSTDDSNVIAPNDPFRSDMEGDTIRYLTSGNTYTIEVYTSATVVQVTPGLLAADIAADLQFDIEKSFDGSSAAAADIIAQLVATEDVFDSDRHSGMYVVFLTAPEYKAYEIGQILNAKAVRLIGVTEEHSGSFAIAHAKGELSTAIPPAYDGTNSVVTPASDMFTSSMVGNTLYFFATGNKYVIQSFTSAAVSTVTVSGNVLVEETGGAHFMVIGQPDFSADDAFTVLNTGGDYELPIDYAAMDGPLTYPAGDGSYQIEIVGEGQIRALRAHSDTSARPKFAAIRPKTYEPTRRTAQVFELLVWPTPSEKKTVTYRYQILYDQIDADHPYPPGGPLLGELYLASCLAVAEQRVKDKRSLRTQEFQERLAAMIDHDRRANRSEFIGSMSGGYAYGDPLLPAGTSRVLYGGVYYDGN